MDGGPRWCFCVEYLEGGSPSGGSFGSAKSKRVDYREVLSETDFAVYARLRDVRKELASSEAVPVYTICTNEQLAAMATRRPETLSAFREIDGLGQAKTEKYGRAFLDCLQSFKGKEPSDDA